MVAVVRDIANKEVRGLTIKMIATIIGSAVSVIITMIFGCIYIVQNIERRDAMNAEQSKDIAALERKITVEEQERKDKDKDLEGRVNNFIEYVALKK